jgi:hypothetical protein
MAGEWINSLDISVKRSATHLIRELERLGAVDAEDWVRSEIEEGIPQTARFLVLRRLWEHIDSWRHESSHWSMAYIDDAEQDPTGAFADAGLAMKKMIQAGITPEEIGCVARMAAYEATFGTLEVIDECCDPDAGEDLPCWILIEADSECEPTGRQIGGLHESILSLDPSGREGRPG